MVKSAPSPIASRKPSKVEGIKENSNFLREPVASEILEETTHFTENAVQLLKFHGSYQQDNRDNRTKGQEKDYQFMLRTKNPGGLVPPQLYLALDKIADEYGNHTLRATTRQGFQLHGILKKNLKTSIATIVNNLGSTLGACGDINRNVMAPPAPFKNRPEYQYAWEYAQNIADLLTAQSGAYYEIWLDGEKAISGEENPEVKAARQRNGNGTIIHDNEEPIYGTHYMPRKFKICVTVPGDNSVDLYSQDLTLVVITNKKGQLEGFNIFAGGGLGRTHGKEETFARLADPIGYVAKDDVYDIVKAIVATQRDYGDRTDRRHARLKYLINDWGVDKFRTQVEEYFGKSIEASKPLPEFKYHDFLGWNEQGDGKLFLGISIDNGRIKDEGSFQLKTALREIVEQFNFSIRLTANHNLIFYDIEPDSKQAIQDILSRHGVGDDPSKIEPLVRYAMACPALPTCGLAITESERAIPGILERVRALLDKVGLQNEHFVVRMTGCPNGCARPYLAELAFVGSAPESYQLWLGGSPNQTRLAQPYTEKLHHNDLDSFLEPIFVYFKKSRKSKESFGDFCDRVGFDAIREFTSSYEPQTANSANKSRHRVNLKEEVYTKLKEVAQNQGKPMTELVSEALEAYFQNLS
ncbi:sulfite reductase, ferredoxin dependent [Nostoc sp.]|uniref:sulfite reductase, ferredoxin dependent n=1 Tax=Nostoc sp. TaxID=1180 RepID=UPI002FF7E9E0